MSEPLQIELKDANLLSAVNAALQVVQQPARLMNAIGARLVSNVQFRFDAKQDPTGAPWAPLSPTTKAIHSSAWFIARNEDFKAGTPGSLLERTRHLRNSLAFNAGDDWVDIGTSRATDGGAWQVGFLHEFGTKKMPRRGLLTADPETGTLGQGDQADILDIIEKAISGAFE